MLLSAARRGFTLIELCVAIGIMLLVIGVAFPSVSGQLGRQRLQEGFDRLDALVATAQQHSVNENKPYVLAWSEDGAVRLYPAEWTAKERRAGPVASLDATAGGEHYTLVRDAALSPRTPAPNWIFWPSGNCEPVTVRFESKAGTWAANYSPLSTRGTLTSFIVR